MFSNRKSCLSLVALILGSFIGAVVDKWTISGAALAVSGAIKAPVTGLVLLVQEVLLQVDSVTA